MDRLETDVVVSIVDGRWIGMVARVAVLPSHRVSHDHKAGQLIDRLVHPFRFERRTMTAFVPTAVS